MHVVGRYFLKLHHTKPIPWSKGAIHTKQYLPSLKVFKWEDIL